MIRLRTFLERARRHPVLGPIVLVALVVLLALVFLHAAEDGHEAATQLGALCLAVLTILGPIVLERIRRTAHVAVAGVPVGRGPPQLEPQRRVTRPPGSGSTFVSPLRR